MSQLILILSNDPLSRPHAAMDLSIHFSAANTRKPTCASPDAGCCHSSCFRRHHKRQQQRR